MKTFYVVYLTPKHEYRDIVVEMPDEMKVNAMTIGLMVTRKTKYWDPCEEYTGDNLILSWQETEELTDEQKELFWSKSLDEPWNATQGEFDHLLNR